MMILKDFPITHFENKVTRSIRQVADLNRFFLNPIMYSKAPRILPTYKISLGRYSSTNKLSKIWKLTKEHILIHLITFYTEYRITNINF